MSGKKKILIVYEKMGMGHQRMANILSDMLKGDDVEIVSLAGSDMQKTNDVYTIVKLWNFLIRKNLIKTCDFILNFFTRTFALPIVEVKQTENFLNALDKEKPDIIISTADGFNKVLGTYAAERKIPFYIFITEISTFIDLICPYATHICYFNETPEAIRSYDFDLAYFSHTINKESTWLDNLKYVLKAHNEFIIHAHKNPIFKDPIRSLEQLNNAKCEVIGPLAEKKHFTHKNVDEVKKKYSIPDDRDTVLIVSGSIGGEFLTEMVETICKYYEKPLNLLVMCGRDIKIYEKAKSMQDPSGMINIMPFGFTDRFDEFIAASDCLIARPSAGIFIESLLNKTPMVTFDRVTSNDRGTLTMIEKYSIGEICSDEDELIPALDKLLENKETYKSNIEKLLRNYYSSYEKKQAAIRELILEDQEKPIPVGGEETDYIPGEEGYNLSR